MMSKNSKIKIQILPNNYKIPNPNNWNFKIGIYLVVFELGILNLIYL